MYIPKKLLVITYYDEIHFLLFHELYF